MVTNLLKIGKHINTTETFQAPIDNFWNKVHTVQ